MFILMMPVLSDVVSNDDIYYSMMIFRGNTDANYDRYLHDFSNLALNNSSSRYLVFPGLTRDHWHNR